MSARLRRLSADYDKLLYELAGHPNIKFEVLEGNPPEKYLITYHVKGLKLNPQTNQPCVTNFHQVEIYLHKDYPREKPKCTMRTGIFHPNFGSWVCIGDYWAAGESLVDVIIQIGDMIQYRSYNVKSPLNAVAARWANNNIHAFPVGNIDLYQPDVSIETIENIDDGLEIELINPGEKPLKGKQKDVDIDFL